MMLGDTSYRKFIKSYEWQTIRGYHLQRNPLCVMCKDKGRVRQAEHVDHIEKCVDDPRLQRDLSNLRSLCAECHRVRHGAKPKRTIGLDGWPIE
jgi:5-methylcytosine-specific restriction protein A